MIINSEHPRITSISIPLSLLTRQLCIHLGQHEGMDIEKKLREKCKDSRITLYVSGEKILVSREEEL